MVKFKPINKITSAGIVLIVFVFLSAFIQPASGATGQPDIPGVNTQRISLKPQAAGDDLPEASSTDGGETMPGTGGQMGLFNSYPASEVRQMMAESSDRKIVFLTFDDGPSNDNTVEILRILKENGVAATFFYVTRGDLENYADVIWETYLNGNSIGIHTNTHDYGELYPGRYADPEAILADVQTAIGKIRSILGEDWDTTVYRFPGGSFSWKGIQPAIQVLSQYGLEYVDWNTMTGDSDQANHDKSSEGLVRFLMDSNDELNAGVHVVLMHDGSWIEGVVGSLQEIIDYYKFMDYEFAVIK